jgi:hypothetical protein
MAGRDLLLVGFLVNATLAARLEFEVFDCVGDVSRGALYASL